jgi:hypothetical protein
MESKGMPTFWLAKIHSLDTQSPKHHQLIHNGMEKSVFVAHINIFLAQNKQCNHHEKSLCCQPQW